MFTEITISLKFRKPDELLAEDPTLQRKRYNPELRPFCACGCGEKVKAYRSKYLKGHKKTCERLPAWKKDKSKFPFCKCGCGIRTNYWDAKFLSGHWAKWLKKNRKEKFKRLLNQNLKDAYRKMSSETKKEWKRKVSERMIGNKNSVGSPGFTGFHHTKKAKKAICNGQIKYLKKFPRKNIPNNSGIGKTGFRKIGKEKIFFRSTWEANFARILYYKEIPFIFEPKWFKMKCDFNKVGYTHYVPDFYIPTRDIYYEVKGYMTENDLWKIKRVQKVYGIKVKVVDKKIYYKMIEKYKDAIKFE